MGCRCRLSVVRVGEGARRVLRVELFPHRETWEGIFSVKMPKVLF